MKISELKQPYRRMAEYLGNENNTISHSLNDNFFRFYNKMHKGEYPEITEDIKTHFPADFDFSGEEVLKLNTTSISLKNWLLHHLDENERNQLYAIATDSVRALIDIHEENNRNSENINNTKSIMLSLEELFNLILETHAELSKMGATGMVSTGRVILNNIDKVANLNKENQRKIEDENLQKRIYTQLAKEGRFNQLPDTCEFSEPVELEVWDMEVSEDLRKITGKFKGNYMDIHCIGWKNAQIPKNKIDFSQLKTGDVVELELVHNEKRIGWFDYVNDNHVVINVLKRKGNQVCNGGSCAGSKMLNKEKIKSITKIK